MYTLRLIISSTYIQNVQKLKMTIFRTASFVKIKIRMLCDILSDASYHNKRILKMENVAIFYGEVNLQSGISEAENSHLSSCSCIKVSTHV
jgi:hypothetical protein